MGPGPLSAYLNETVWRNQANSRNFWPAGSAGVPASPPVGSGRVRGMRLGRRGPEAGRIRGDPWIGRDAGRAARASHDLVKSLTHEAVGGEGFVDPVIASEVAGRATTSSPLLLRRLAADERAGGHVAGRRLRGPSLLSPLTRAVVNPMI